MTEKSDKPVAQVVQLPEAQLVTQPSDMPTRKIFAVILMGMIMGIVQSIVPEIFPALVSCAPEVEECTKGAEVYESIRVWITPFIMALTGYVIKDEAQKPKTPA